MRSLILLMGTVTLLACSDASPTTESGDNTAPGYALIGNWQGSVSTSTGSADLTDAKAELSLVSASKQASGTFQLALIGIEGATATGTFQDFMGRSLHLTLAESAISKLGQKGDTVVLDYNHAGNSLLLTNKNLELQLLRTTESSETPGSADGRDATAHALIGYWSCLDPQGLRWTFHLKSTSQFWLEITRADSQPQWSSGSVSTVDDKTLTLVVEDSNVDSFLGTTLDLTAISPSMAGVELREDQEVRRSFRCDRR